MYLKFTQVDTELTGTANRVGSVENVLESPYRPSF